MPKVDVSHSGTIKISDHYSKTKIKPLKIIDKKIIDAQLTQKFDSKKYKGTISATIKNKKVVDIKAKGDEKFSQKFEKHKKELIKMYNKLMKKI